MAVTLQIVEGSAGAHGQDDRELRSVLDWLKRERIPGVRVDPVQPTPDQGEMGALTEALTVVGSSGTGAAVAGALVAWLRTRRPFVRIAVADATGVRYEMEVSATSEGDAALTQFLERALPGAP